MKHQAKFTKDPAHKQLLVTRSYDAPVDKVWKAWTVSSILDQWWGPKPWKAETKTMEFKPGGRWHYAMVGPNGERHWSLVEFKSIDPQRSFRADCVFCDENGVSNNFGPMMRWYVEFSATPTGSRIDVTLTFDQEADLQRIVEMGFEGGFSMGLSQLDELLEDMLVV
jgi:uncharacterized protein YndB with AHSA1/START domain